jgi:NADPH-dependent curcumin reductase CurA
LDLPRLFKLNNQQLMNMNYQITDLAVMTSSGQNPFIMIMQQGMQMADILTVAAGQTLTLRGAMGAVGQAVTRFFTNPLNLAVIGIASVAGAIPLIWQSINGTEAEEAKTTLEQFREFLDEISESAEEAGDEMRRVFEQLSANTYTETLRSAQEQQRALNDTITDSINVVDAISSSPSPVV